MFWSSVPGTAVRGLGTGLIASQFFGPGPRHWTPDLIEMWFNVADCPPSNSMWPDERRQRKTKFVPIGSASNGCPGRDQRVGPPAEEVHYKAPET